MAKLPITASIAITANDGHPVLTVTLTDGDGVQFATCQNTADAGARPVDAIGFAREWTRNQLADYLGWGDLPPSFTVQVGLDASMRELDLI